MKICLLSFFLTLGLIGYGQNSCLEALPLSAGTFIVDSIDGDEPVAICTGQASNATNGEWYIYTASQNYNVTITSDLQANIGGDTRFQVYSGDCDNLVCLDGDDDGGNLGNGYLSTLELPVLEGETIYIVWDDHWNDNGFIFKIIEEDYIVPPISFTSQNVQGEGNTLGLVDMNGDYMDDVVRVQTGSGAIHINYQLPEGGFNSVAINNEPTTHGPSWSMAAGDLDGNGFNDLLFGGGSGVTFMIANEDGTAYTEITGSQYVFSQRSNFIDINNDGFLDAFVCHDVQPNVYYINDGDGNLEFFQGGLGDSETGGNYGSIWVDYDMDGDTDLFIAKCRGGSNTININQLHRNNGDGTYTEIASELDLDDPVQTWSSAWGDYDNDGDLDIFIGASSFSDGGHKLMQNNGDGTFIDITEGSGFENINNSGIENVCHDFDNDGYLDILGMGGTLMMNNGDMTFTEYDTDINNGAVGDANNDGFLDVLNGQLKINNGNDNNWIKFSVQGVVSNLNGIGAMVHLYSTSGQQIRQVRSGDGFRYMSSLNLHFGLGQDTQIDSVTVDWPSGIHTTLIHPYVNTFSNLLEVEGTVVSVDENKLKDLVIFPNPTADRIFIDYPNSFSQLTYALFDVNGKLLLEGIMSRNVIDISALSKGTYIIQLDVDGITTERKIVKE